MTTVISGSSPSITFSDSTTQTTAFTSTPSVTTITTSSDASISGLTVGLGAGSIASNTAFGLGPLAANTTGNFNVAIGRYALTGNTTGSNNSGLGRQALSSNTTGSFNTGVGNLALYSNTTADNNTAVGYQAGYAATVGANTYIGYGAGSNHATGSNCTYIGTSAVQASATGVNYEIVMGGGITGIGSGYFAFGVNGVGVVYNQFSTNASWTKLSDSRLKTNIQTDTLGLSFITRLQPKTYKWKPSNEVPQEFTNLYSEENKKDTTTVMHGLIAQEVKAALDAEGVSTFGGWNEQSDGCQGVASDMFIFPLINAIKELKTIVDAQAAEIAELKAKVG